MAIPPKAYVAGAVAVMYTVRWTYKTFFQRLSKESRKFLFENFRYYRCLTPAERKRFDRRVLFYLLNKEWTGRNGFDISHEVKLTLSAIAVKLTFGFDDYELPHFKHFIIYPERYFSTITGQMHKGEVNLQGIVVLNWEDLMEGAGCNKDGVHLGIHEFAHAVYFENLKDNTDYFFISKEDLQHWYDTAHLEIERMEREGTHFFRDYAFTNKEEFWAVSTENFFERPEVFKETLPDYYACMVRTFQQDPAAIYLRGEAPISVA